MLRERFAANLRKARKAAGYSQVELSRRTGMHRTEISLLERAGREPRLSTILKLASALGVKASRLLAGIRWDEDAKRFVVDE